MTSLLVSGSAGGIGAAIAEAGVARGWTVTGLDRTADTAAGVDHRIADVTDEDAVAAVLADIGPVDVAVCCAGIVRFGPLADIALDEWRTVVEVNLTGTFVVARCVAQAALAAGRPASIVNVASINGVVPGPGAGAYGPTKAAVMTLTAQMALEWAPHIRVNAVAPGLIDAGMSTQLGDDPDLRDARARAVPLGRLGEATDVADVALWLASDEARYVTGQTIVVDGGIASSILTTLPRPGGAGARP